jgi:hypothetical protein
MYVSVTLAHTSISLKESVRLYPLTLQEIPTITPNLLAITGITTPRSPQSNHPSNMLPQSSLLALSGVLVTGMQHKL